MTIDERLEALARRHESLSHAVELMAAMQRDSDKTYQERFADNEVRLAQLMDTMNRLGRILEIHDAAIDDRGKRPDDMENGKHAPGR